MYNYKNIKARILKYKYKKQAMQQLAFYILSGERKRQKGTCVEVGWI